MSKTDYNFKSYVIREHSDLLKRYNQCSLYEYLKDNFFNNGVISNNHKHNHSYESMYDLFNECVSNGLVKEFEECKRIINANYKRVCRLRNRVKEILLSGSCLFLTLTFTDSVLNDTNEETRRKYVLRFLKSYSNYYVANIDFGKDYDREHYHALIMCDKVNNNDWKYGNINFKRVRNRNIDKDAYRLSKYISKLTNHCIKETNKRQAVLYSRELRA